MKTSTDQTTGNITFEAESGMAICQKNESGPSLITDASAPANTPLDTWKDCAYGVEIRYSVRSIIKELKALGKFAEVRTFLEAANYDWEFIGSNYLASSDEDFQTMCKAMVDNQLVAQEELDSLLSRCYWKSDIMS